MTVIYEVQKSLICQQTPKETYLQFEIASETHRRLMRRLRKIVFAKKGKQISVSASAQLADFPD